MPAKFAHGSRAPLPGRWPSPETVLCSPRAARRSASHQLEPKVGAEPSLECEVDPKDRQRFEKTNDPILLRLFCRIELIAPALAVGSEDPADFVPHAAEHGQLCLIGSGGVRRIIKAPMMAVDLTGKDRTGLVGVATHRDD